MNREILDKWCERGILGLVLAILIFGPLAMGAVEIPYFLVIEGLTIAVMFLWLARLWINPRPRLLWPPICWAVLAFGSYAVIRYLTADIEYVARMEMVRIWVYAFLFLAILSNLHRQEHTQLITFTLVFLAMAISFYAMDQFFTDSDKVWFQTRSVDAYLHRASGTYISPNHLAGFLEMVIPLGLAWLLVSRAKPVMKVFLGYASFVILAGIAVTVSRAAWISVGIALAALFGLLLTNRTHRIPAALLLLVILAAGVYFVPRTHFFKERFKQISEQHDFNGDARYDLWEAAVKLWRQNIWWGIGPAHFDYRFREFRPPTEQFQPDRVHNDYLNTLTDWGIVGVLLVASAWALLTAGVVRTWRFVRASASDLGGRRSNKFALVLGASVGLLAILIHSLLDFNMHIPANAILTIVLMAILSSCLRFATESHWFSARMAAKIALTILLAGGMSYFGWQGTRRLTEYKWLQRAGKAPDYSPTQAEVLTKALAAEPMNAESAYAIGKVYRAQGWGDADAELLEKAMGWFKRASKLDPYNGYCSMYYGMCLDRLDKQNEAWPYFEHAIRLDPNGYFAAANVGWHYVQTGDYAAARSWLERSMQLRWQENQIASSYLGIVQRLMLETATNSPSNTSDAPSSK